MNNHSFAFKTAHKCLCFAIVRRIYYRCLAGYYFGDIKVSAKNCLLVDGNHRYIAYLLAGVEFGVTAWTCSDSDISLSFSALKIDYDDDWDSYSYNRLFITDGTWLESYRRNAL